MKKCILSLILILLTVCAGLVPSFAGRGQRPVKYTYQPYTPVASGQNEPFNDVPWLINDEALYQLYKFEVPDGKKKGVNSEHFSVNIDNQSDVTWKYLDKEFNFNAKDGTWITGTPNTDFRLYFSTKAGSGNPRSQSGGGYALYAMNTDWDISKAVTWSSLEKTIYQLCGIDGKSLSHITFWAGTSSTPMSPTPEPGSLLLLGIGLLAAAGLGRKKFKS